jgi:archaellum component FlaC
MPVFSGLVRRVVVEAERQVRGGLDLLTRLTREHAPGAEALRMLPALDARLNSVEEALGRQDETLRALRTDLDALVTDLNRRLLPRIDERMDDTERDLAALATGLIRAGKDDAGQRSRLESLDRRLTDMRTKVVQLEQRTGLWRELQATLARLGDDVDRLRGRLDAPADPGSAGAATAPPTSAASPTTTPPRPPSEPHHTTTAPTAQRRNEREPAGN